jgi:hypothetical protein
MDSSDRSTSILAVVVVALLTAATIGLSAFVISSTPTGAVAAATGSPAPTIAVLEPSPTSSTDPASSSPSDSASPPPSSSPSPKPKATPKPVLSMNLYGKGDFVSELTPKQCVSAAMQIMLNITGRSNDRSSATQTALAKLAKSLSNAPYGGTEPLGWARGLQKRGAGKYEVLVEPTMMAAVKRGIVAMRATGRPVGLLVWRGAHSWVLHGFEATADPAGPDAWSVKYVYVSDPWYPRLSRIWGRSRGPNAKITPKQLTVDYLKWKRPTGRYPGMDGKYVLVIPVNG